MKSKLRLLGLIALAIALLWGGIALGRHLATDTPEFRVFRAFAARPPLVFPEPFSLFTPSGRLDDATPSLESAFPNEMYISRTVQPAGGVVHYEVRIYAPEIAYNLRREAMEDVVITINDEAGAWLFSSSLVTYANCEMTGSKDRFARFGFSVRESLEKTAVINIGRFNGMRTFYYKYRLPLKTIDHPKATDRKR